MKDDSTPMGFRKQLARDIEADYEVVREALREAIRATKIVKTSCPKCSKPIEVEVSDASTAVRAIEVWSREGFGRAESESKESPECPSCTEVKAMSDGDIENGMVEWLTGHGYRVEKESAAA